MSTEGNVKWFDKKKGYGFIKTQSGNELFVHASNIEKDGEKFLEEGQNVTFEITEGKKGPEAVRVKIIKD